ncbi:MAG: toll/interleukin-1 receptor domain-containing protein [Promethearchaeota archaeon]|jgi:hypothetical protein
MLYEFTDWANYFIIIGIFIFSIAIGIFFIIKSRETKVVIIGYTGIISICIGLMFLGSILDFFTIVFFDINIEEELFGIFTYIWIPPLILSAIYIGIEMMVPKQKLSLLSIYTVLSGMFLVSIIFFPGDSFTFINITSGIYLGDSRFSFPNPAFIIMIIFLSSVLCFNGIGILLRSFKSTGLVRKKYILISIGFTTFAIYSFIESLFIGPLVFFARIFMVSSPLLLYFGFKGKSKKEKPKRKKIPSEKERKFRSFLLGKDKPVVVKEDQISHIIKREGEIVVFASYSTKDAPLYKVGEISHQLTQFPEIKNVLYWEEHNKDNFIKFMNDNLGKCDVVLLFCSENAKTSIPVEKEWTAADALGKPIIPIFYDPFHIPPLLHSRIGLDFDFYDMERNVEKLHDMIMRKSETRSI